MKTITLLLLGLILCSNAWSVERDQDYQDRFWKFEYFGDVKQCSGFGTSTAAFGSCKDAIQEAVDEYLDNRGSLLRSCEALGGVMTCDSPLRRTRNANGRVDCDYNSSIGLDFYDHFMVHYCVCNPPTGTSTAYYTPGSFFMELEGRSNSSCELAYMDAKHKVSTASKVYKSSNSNNVVGMNLNIVSTEHQAGCRFDERDNFVVTLGIKGSAHFKSSALRMMPINWNNLEILEPIRRYEDHVVRRIPMRPVRRPVPVRIRRPLRPVRPVVRPTRPVRRVTPRRPVRREPLG